MSLKKMLAPSAMALALLSLTGVQAAEETAAGVSIGADSASSQLLDLLRSLRGDYGFTLTQACVRTPFQPAGIAGIDPVTRRLLVTGEQFDAVGSGLLRFGRDGVVTLENGMLSEVSSSMLGVGQAPVSAPTPFTCSGPYTLQQSTKLSLTLSCKVSNPPPGLTVSIGPLPFAGFVGPGRLSLTLSTVGNEVHKVSIASGETVLQERDRICLQSMTLDKIQ